MGVVLKSLPLTLPRENAVRLDLVDGVVVFKASSSVLERVDAREVDALVGQPRHDARRRHVGEARFVGHAQDLGALGGAQGMGGCGTHGPGPAIARYESCGP